MVVVLARRVDRLQPDRVFTRDTLLIRGTGRTDSRTASQRALELRESPAESARIPHARRKFFVPPNARSIRRRRRRSARRLRSHRLDTARSEADMELLESTERSALAREGESP